jgi:RecJ-like exonuclease
LDEVEKFSKVLKSLLQEKKAKIISHHDSDGIVSASIITKMLLRENLPFELKIVKQLTSEITEDLHLNEDEVLILTDLGSGQLPLLKDFLDKTQVFILDHHEPSKLTHLNLFHLNPLVFKEEEISSSVICYLLAKTFNLKNTDLIDLAVVGAVADEQEEKWELKGLTKKILKEAEVLGKISILKGLRLYGRSKRPVYKSLAYSFDPFIPGISGSESQAVQFLSELNIKIKENDEWKKLKDLTLEEQKRLASAIILERLKTNSSEAEDIFGYIYLMLGKPEEIQDVREFATLMNACGRTNNFDVAMRLCLGDFSAIEESFEVLDQYRKLISKSISWVRENENSILETKFASYILAKNKIPETLIGTITSIALNSNLVNTRKPIFGLARAENGKIKVSARASRDLKKINLRNVIVSATKQLGAEGGGHSKAAGALISKEKEKEFIKSVDNLLGEIDGSKKG